MLYKQWKKDQVWPFFGCCTADSPTDKSRHQPYNNGSLVLFSAAWWWCVTFWKLPARSHMSALVLASRVTAVRTRRESHFLSFRAPFIFNVRNFMGYFHRFALYVLFISKFWVNYFIIFGNFRLFYLMTLPPTQSRRHSLMDAKLHYLWQEALSDAFSDKKLKRCIKVRAGVQTADRHKVAVLMVFWDCL